MLQPGDLILVKSEGWLFAAARRLGGNPYDHVAVVVRDGQTLNIHRPRGRLLPEERLLRPGLRPLVLRPRWRSDEERDRFVSWMQGLAGLRYDTRRTLRLILALLLKRVLRLSLPLAAPSRAQRAWICTDAVLLGLERHGEGFAALEELPLDWRDLRCGTTNDFLVIHGRRPDLLARVEPP